MSTLLVVNDDPIQLRLAAALLERAGHDVHTATSAERGLEVLREHEDIAGLVTDLHMPEIDGWRFCRLLRSPEYRPFNELPILVMSATFSGDDAERLTTELGANAFLPAPYEPGDLVRLVADMLEGRAPAAILRALLVQNESAQSEALARALRDHGYQVAVARTLAEGRDRFAKGSPGTVVLDYELPDGRADALLPELCHPGSASIAVVTTTEEHPKLAFDLMQQGADGYVREAYDPDYVIALCERARRQRALLRVEDLLEERTVSLRESEARQRAILHAIPEILLVYESDGSVLHANPAAVEILGSLVGRNLREVVISARVADLERHLGALRDSRTRRYETDYRTASGHPLQVEVTESPFHFDGRDAILAVARDISARRRAEEERALLATALEQADEMIIVSDNNRRIQYVNPAFERITGYDRGEALGQSTDLLGGTDAAAWKEMQLVLRSGQAWHGRIQRRRKDGSVYLSEGTVSPVKEGDDRVVHYVGVERDVSQEVELEHALQQAQKMEAVGTLAGGIAHDFNNLLTAILGYANIVRQLTPTGSEVAQMAEIIEGTAERAAELTKQLLGFARRGKHRNLPLDLNDTVRHVVKLLSRTIDKGISIRTRLRARPPTIMGDPAQMEQALLNLALNARDAMSDTPEAELVFETDVLTMDREYCRGHPGARPGRYALVSVTDNGCGIPPKDLVRIFEPFFTTKRAGEGTGMGLSMVYGIVKSHGGTIRVYSEVAHGTRFKVYVPLVEEEKLQSEPVLEPAEPVRGSGRLLVIDDEEVVRQIAATMLKHLGYEVISFGDAEEAVLYYQNFGETVEAVLIDMVMPGLDGHSCFRKLRELDPEVKAVLTTGFGLNDAAQRILDDGALGFAQKPYRLAELSQAVAAAIRGERYATATGDPQTA